MAPGTGVRRSPTSAVGGTRGEWRRDVFDAARLLLCDDVEECRRQSSEVPDECYSSAVGIEQILGGEGRERERHSGVTVFKSVGAAVLDVAAAKYLVDLAGEAWVEEST